MLRRSSYSYRFTHSLSSHRLSLSRFAAASRALSHPLSLSLFSNHLLSPHLPFSCIGHLLGKQEVYSRARARARARVCVCVCVWTTCLQRLHVQGSQGLVGYLTQRSYASKMDESMDACSCTCREYGMGDAVTACILQHKSRALFQFCKTRFSGSVERNSTCQTCQCCSCMLE